MGGNIQEKKEKIKFLIMDVDGTLTDGNIYMGVQGEILKCFNIKDGTGIKDLLPVRGIIPIVITGRCSKITENRCKELNISYIYQGCRNKKNQLKNIAEDFMVYPQNGIYEEFAYIGDDLIDLESMRCSGISGCPSDAVDVVKAEADFISEFTGGKGAVREFIEWIIQKQS